MMRDLKGHISITLPFFNFTREPMKPILVFLAVQWGRRKRGKQSLQYFGTTQIGEQSRCEKAVPDSVSAIQETTLKAS